jgi:hypothetical protein
MNFTIHIFNYSLDKQQITGKYSNYTAMNLDEILAI